ncbi:hypothetical protein GVN21_18305 [Caulobacter sp. SLTY]|uniref:hypothetical protein n=1 Tax=Caulobacter sp. SLTY TaxID=2683262 RepID=UPI00141353A6|nr:hypothetical protein [Caulobacter sp. SLTY]NBB17320.1 hypothetical protein [Caulobacter sp. SLTY]
MALCHLLYVGVLCISPVSGGPTPLVEQEVRLEARRGSTWTGVDIRAEGWSALAVAGTDNVMTVNPKTLSRACEGDACIQYHRFCRPLADQKTECEFTIVRPEWSQPMVITVQAYGPERQEAALRSLTILTSQGKFISLEAMGETSTREDPYCARLRRGESGPVYEAGCEFINR